MLDAEWRRRDTPLVGCEHADTILLCLIVDALHSSVSANLRDLGLLVSSCHVHLLVKGFIRWWAAVFVAVHAGLLGVRRWWQYLIFVIFRVTHVNFLSLFVHLV